MEKKLQADSVLFSLHAEIVQAGTSEFAMAALSAAESAEEEIEEEPVYHREPLLPLSSQMTVPETPSPDVLEYKYCF